MKRNHEDAGGVEELLGQICSKMKNLSTSESTTQSNDEVLTAFISVLNCTQNEATFFLESSLWDIERAIHFWLESDKGAGSRQSNRRYKNDISSSSSSISNSFHEPIARYEHRNLNLIDLPNDWSAWIHPQSGSIYFLHQPSGVVQYSVPPGYADIKNNDKSESSYFHNTSIMSIPNVTLSMNSLHQHNTTFTPVPQQQIQQQHILNDQSDGCSNESIRADCDSHTHNTNDDMRSMPGGFDDFDELNLKFSSSSKSGSSTPIEFRSLSNAEDILVNRIIEENLLLISNNNNNNMNNHSTSSDCHNNVDNNYYNDESEEINSRNS